MRAHPVKPDVLVLEDSPETQRVLEACLRGFCTPVIVGTIRAAREAIEQTRFALFVFDWSLPDGNALDLCMPLRDIALAQGVPTVFVTAEGRTETKVLAFEWGAVDYIQKPFDLTELRARLQAILKRVTTTNPPRLERGPFAVDFARQRIFQDGAELDLTPYEFRLLAHFIRHEDHVFSRDQILSLLTGEHSAVGDRTVDVHISHLRKKLGPHRRCLRAVRGAGYRFQIAKMASRAA